MQDFQYHRPTTLDDAAGLLGANDEAKLLAGGQSLIPVMKLDMAAPTDLVSLAAIPGLATISADAEVVEIGAMATHAKVAAAAEVRGAIPALAELAGRIGDPQVRNRGTLGGSLAHCDPAADYPAAVLALGGTVLTDRRAIPADEYFLGMFETALESDEIIRAVRFPVPARAGYAKFANPASKYAIVGVMVVDTGAGARVAVTGAGPAVFRWSAAEDALSRDFSVAALAGIAAASDELLGDMHASAEYRAHLMGVMARRAVALALG